MVQKSTKQDVVNRRYKGKMVFERTKVYASTQSKSNDSGYKRVKAKSDTQKSYHWMARCFLKSFEEDERCELLGATSLKISRYD